MKRENKIIKVSIIGIVANIFLCIFKALVGIFSNSIAIIIDAVNNLSDAFSSVVTIIGTKLALKEPDKKHPFGHGRIEYLSATLIAIIILYAGVSALIESVKKIINPPVPNYSTITFIIIITATIVKIILGLYVKKSGKKLNSQSLINSGVDALADAVISFSTLIGVTVYLIFNLALESYIGVLISIFIIRSGIKMIMQTFSQILGERISSTVAYDLKKTVNSFKEVRGAYDLMLNNYGPDIYMGSIHIEVDEDMSAKEIDNLTRKITQTVYKKHNVHLLAIGIYSFDSKNKKAVEIRDKISRIVHLNKEVLQMHAFNIDEETKTISFDLIIDYDQKNRSKIYKEICSDVKYYYPEYKFDITMDIDASE